jgi:LysR family transcriptional regulator, cell division regulator
VALYSIKQFLPALSVIYPMLDFNFIHVLSREMTEKVINWEADFGIVVNSVKHPDLVIIKLCTDIVTIFYKEGCHNKLIYDPNLAQSQSILIKIQNSLVNLEGEICSGNIEVISSLTALGSGYGVLPSRIAAKYQNLKLLSNAPIFKDKICLIF